MAINQNSDGSFTLTIGSDLLSKGLRPASKLPRNSGFLTTCNGCVGKDGALTSLDEITRIATTEITDAFPYPQIFVFTNVIIVCSATKIYELVAGALVEKLEVTIGLTWSGVSFYDYAYLSNGVVAVKRDVESKDYSITTDLPIASAICDFNGQVLIGQV